MEKHNGYNRNNKRLQVFLVTQQKNLIFAIAWLLTSHLLTVISASAVLIVYQYNTLEHHCCLPDQGIWKKKFLETTTTTETICACTCIKFKYHYKREGVGNKLSWNQMTINMDIKHNWISNSKYQRPVRRLYNNKIYSQNTL